MNLSKEKLLALIELYITKCGYDPRYLLLAMTINDVIANPSMLKSWLESLSKICASVSDDEIKKLIGSNN